MLKVKNDLILSKLEKEAIKQVKEKLFEFNLKNLFNTCELVFYAIKDIEYIIVLKDLKTGSELFILDDKFSSLHKNSIKKIVEVLNQEKTFPKLIKEQEELFKKEREKEEIKKQFIEKNEIIIKSEVEKSIKKINKKHINSVDNFIFNNNIIIRIYFNPVNGLARILEFKIGEVLSVRNNNTEWKEIKIEEIKKYILNFYNEGLPYYKKKDEEEKIKKQREEKRRNIILLLDNNNIIQYNNSIDLIVKNGYTTYRKSLKKNSKGSLIKITSNYIEKLIDIEDIFILNKNGEILYRG